MSSPLHSSRVFLGRRFESKEDAIRAIGEVMVEAGDVTPRYVEGMIEKEAQFSTWITEGVALPHGTNEVKGEVAQSSIVVMQIPEGVQWGQGRLVYLAIGLAGKGDGQHLKLLASLAGILQCSENLDRLRRTMDKEEAIQILTGQGGGS